jgi:hypothetical protein
MAQPPRQTDGDGGANFVRQIVSDPKNVPDVMLLTGYLGASSEEGHERLYLSPDLSSYVEIPTTAILNRAPLPVEQDANGGVTLWVKKDAKLQYKLAPAAQALANYFAGAIQAGAQGAAGAGFGPAGIPQPTPTAIPTYVCTHFTPCIPTRFQPQCPYPSEICTHVGACDTQRPGVCPLPQAAGAAGAGPQGRSFVDCSIICPTRIGPCLSHHHTCAPCASVQCTIACPTHFVSCNPACNITRFEPACNVTRFETCNPACFVTRAEVSCVIACNVTNAVFCPIASGPACPQVSFGCPQASLGCGGFPGQPGFGGQVAEALALRGNSLGCATVLGCPFPPPTTHCTAAIGCHYPGTGLLCQW